MGGIFGLALCYVFVKVNQLGFILFQPSPGSVSTPQQNELVSEQTAKIGSLFARQLAIPLLGKHYGKNVMSF